MQKFLLLRNCSLFCVLVVSAGCSSDSAEINSTDENVSGATDSGDTVDNGNSTENGNTPNSSNDSASVVFSCDQITTMFITRGSANPDLAEPEVSASCSDDTVTVTSNGIPDFPYIATSPGVPESNIVDYIFPASPAFASNTTAIPIVGEIGVAKNGIPIYGPTEGPGGDVNSRPGGFTECGGHNGPTGYHYHLFDVTGSDYCLFTESDVADGPILFGYALDGFPIFSGNNLYRSSWYLSDESLFATDTWSAHSYLEGSGDLDECNGRTDENGNYAYYTTEEFPYVLGCFRGEPSLIEPAGTGGPQR